jgi:hypothetical protein
MTEPSTFAAAALASLWGIDVEPETAARVDAGVRGLLTRAWPAIVTALDAGDASSMPPIEAPVTEPHG